MAGSSKSYFVNAALRRIGIAGQGFTITPDELVDGCNILDAMMAEWDAAGLHIGYPIATPATTDPAAETGVYPYAVEAVTTNLALRLADSYGRDPMPGTQKTAVASKAVIMLRAARAPKMGLPNTMPAGAGNKPYLYNDGPFLQRPAETIDVADEGELTFND